jgi:hypothetical protein
MNLLKVEGDACTVQGHGHALFTKYLEGVFWEGGLPKDGVLGSRPRIHREFTETR